MMTEDLDVVVVGAGFAGLAALHLLREQGLRVRAYDEAGNVGGTWWWHAYPGSHLDTECHVYQYFFSEALYRDWGWSERYPAGYEVQRWLRFVADRLDLRRDISARHAGRLRASPTPGGGRSGPTATRPCGPGTWSPAPGGCPSSRTSTWTPSTGPSCAPRRGRRTGTT